MGSKVKRLIHFLMQAVLMTVKLERLIVFIYGTIYTLCAIDTGKASKYDVMRFLRQRMNINGMKAGNEIAFQKWKDDYNFIRSL